MFKEIKYSIFIIVISLSIFLTGKYYFSDENIKKSYRSYDNIDERIEIYSKELPILENNTNDAIEYISKINQKKKNLIFGNF